MLYLCSAKRKKEENRPRSPLKLVSRKSSYYSLAAQTTTSTAVKLLLPRTAQAQQRSRYNIRPPPGHLPIHTPLNIKSNLYPTPPLNLQEMLTCLNPS